VSGDHPCTKDEARDLAALQCQITFGDCNGKNKNLVTYVPPIRLIVGLEERQRGRLLRGSRVRRHRLL
jgi:hypothetical protein